MTLLGQHRLALNNSLHPIALQNVAYDLVVLFSISRPVNHSPQRRRVALELLQVLGQIGERMNFDLGRHLAQSFPLGQRLGHAIALLPNKPQCPVMPVRSLFVSCKTISQSSVVSRASVHQPIPLSVHLVNPKHLYSRASVHFSVVNLSLSPEIPHRQASRRQSANATFECRLQSESTNRFLN